jgi:signal transduction histidine kinase
MGTWASGFGGGKRPSFCHFTNGRARVISLVSVSLPKKILVGMVLTGQLDAKNINLAITSPDATLDTVQYATGDGFRLEHVLANFLSNAIKFSPQNSTITIVVGTDKEKDEIRAAEEREAEAARRSKQAGDALEKLGC